ncbi:flavin reductase family protein [Brevibacterium sp. UCMA 11754]|uniref:flavin reductase family protein n=1 Tax=Brevibacterium sp. UCMA 11754 TaxID=2749198 RepID=UPI001F31E198|nr:flavin reductase family protein [Brevibacterium sp. UCMA 11754]MCF2573900.1 flavin reductase [Brevibacterium sp. UCMA 11754]
MDQETFDNLMVSADAGLIVVTTAAEDEWAGCLVGFHSQASMSPQQYGFWLSKANHTYHVSLRAAHFAIHFLTADDFAMAQRFGARSGEDTDKFRGLDVHLTEQGVPLLSALPNRMDVERISMLDDGGDHVAITVRVISSETSGAFAPLRLSHIGDLSAGRDNAERAIQL